MTEKTATPAEITRWRKRIRQHLADIEYQRMAEDDPLPDLDGVLDDDVLDELAARILEDVTLLVRSTYAPGLTGVRLSDGEDTSRG